MVMKVNFSFFNDSNRSEYVKEFFIIPSFCFVTSKMHNGFSLRWGFWVFLTLWKYKNN
jgi:hypothetical protein